MKKGLTTFLGVLLLTCNSAFAQQPAPKRDEPHKYRTILMLAGGGGGFLLGTFAGLATFDDAINSDRKVWTTAALSAVGGAVGGYFLGRALDKRKKKTDVTRVADEFYLDLMRSQWPSCGAEVVANSRQDQNLRILPALSPPSIESGRVMPTGVSGYYDDLSRIYLLAALQKMEPSK